MKIPFRKNQMQKIEATVASLAKRGEQLAVKRATAQNALEKAVKARQEALLSGDLDDQRALDKLQGMVDSAKSALEGIDDAVALLAQQKAEADSQLAAQRELIERAAAADKLNAQVAAIEAMLDYSKEQHGLDHPRTAVERAYKDVRQALITYGEVALREARERERHLLEGITGRHKRPE